MAPPVALSGVTGANGLPAPGAVPLPVGDGAGAVTAGAGTSAAADPGGPRAIGAAAPPVARAELTAVGTVEADVGSDLGSDGGFADSAVATEASGGTVYSGTTRAWVPVITRTFFTS